MAEHEGVEPDIDHTCSPELVETIERYLKSHGYGDEQMLTTDILIVVVSKGFRKEGTVTGTAVLTPTESSLTTMLGMAQYAVIKFGNLAARSMVAGEDEDE